MGERVRRIATLSLIRKLFRWRQPPPAPLTAEELLEIKLAFVMCRNDCPIGIIFRALIEHIELRERQLSEAKENYDR